MADSVSQVLDRRLTGTSKAHSFNSTYNDNYTATVFPRL